MDATGLYVGFDCSTQSLTAVVVDAGRREVVYRTTFRFDDELPEFGTSSGVLPSADPLEVHAPPLMWAAALGRGLERVARNVDAASIRAISGAAQQHGSVYCTAAAERLFVGSAAADPFSRQTAPVWMDASAARECLEIEEAVGGAHALAVLTGSRAYPRFTGPQIRRFAATAPAAYDATARIHLVSSFMASLLAGAHAPIDHADGSGMNLMDIQTREWSSTALAATAPDLRRRLPDVTHSWRVIGTLAPHWRTRFALPPARVIAWSGDNPCSLIGLGLVSEGALGISLGTSDTIFGPMRAPRVSHDGTGHVFASPTGDYMGITVFRNGSLARERIRKRFGLDWAGFSAALRATPPGNGGAMMLPWFEPEITPHVPTSAVKTFGIDEQDAATHVRAIIEGQVMALARHSEWMGVRPGRVHATGGAAVNSDLLQVIADVFDADVFRADATDSAALGAAIRALHADCLADGVRASWEEIVDRYAGRAAEPVARPVASHVEIYRALRSVHRDRERAALAS